MSEHKSDGGGSILGNPNALFALLTIAGGLWLVSQKLTSDRPVISAGTTDAAFGDQKLEARLWEDPFKAHVTEGPKEDPVIEENMGVLVRQVSRRLKESNPSGRGMLLLPVMIAGGPYSEDQESRIRSRFAIVSALGQSGYVPEDAEHLGVLRIPWPTEQELADPMRARSPVSAGVSPALRDIGSADLNSAESRWLGTRITTASHSMRVRYEWYRTRVFANPASPTERYSNILVLWLDDTMFEDEPNLRLALLMERLTDQRRDGVGGGAVETALIGPRRSATLRAMLPPWGGEPAKLVKSPEIVKRVKDVLGRIQLYCATPSAMDEVLVRSIEPLNGKPRDSVKSLLGPQGEGFASFHNFSATDAQLAREVLEELKLRGADLAATDLEKKVNHVVLISEWDTFYARMLSLTYRSEISVIPHKGFTRGNFVSSFVDQPGSWKGEPKNFHSFVYLRGLDGQIAGGEGRNKDDADARRNGKARPSSLDELREWAPDENKAEGQAQFDYLGRMGDQIEQLEDSLRREEKGRIRAIGIVGSDVYDTLLILQALRRRFPGVLFFTKDLDVRFLHPREHDWARNLIVVSSYGLALHPELQGEVASFRDSTQTAQFAATLAALGHEQLAKIEEIPPRRFEVGHSVAVDLSVDPKPATQGASNAAPLQLHPLTRTQLHGGREFKVSDRVNLGIAAVFLLLLGGTFVVPSWRQLTWGITRHPSEILNYTTEDIGGPDGAQAFISQLAERIKNSTQGATENSAQSLNPAPPENPAKEPDFKAYEKVFPSLIPEKLTRLTKLNEEIKDLKVELQEHQGNGRRLPAARDEVRVLHEELEAVDWEREGLLAELTDRIVSDLNRILARAGDAKASGDLAHELNSLARTTVATPSTVGWVVSFLRGFRFADGMIARFDARRTVDAFLDQVTLKVKHGAEDVASSHKPESTDIFTPLRQCFDALGRAGGVVLDKLFGDLTPPRQTIGVGATSAEQAAVEAAGAARDSAQIMFNLRCRRILWGWIGGGFIAVVVILLSWAIWRDSLLRSDGEPFSLTTGVSAWPAEIVRLLVFALAVSFFFGLLHKLREGFLALTRAFRLSPRPSETDQEANPSNHICAQVIWYEYRRSNRFRLRLGPIALAIVVYILFLKAIRIASGESSFKPLRGDMIASLDPWFLWASVLGFLLLAFLTMDMAWLCRRFIEKLSAGPTRYPEATRKHFSRTMGRVDDDYLDEWIDLQLIAELTERIGRLVYYPAGLLLLLVLARISWWDGWPWPVSLVTVFVLNFVLALASVVILQRSAKQAKHKAEQSLEAKVKRSQARVAPNAAVNNVTQAQALLDEIRRLNRGAFVPFWDNPVVGAVFLSSGGTTLLQMAVWFMAH